MKYQTLNAFKNHIVEVLRYDKSNLEKVSTEIEQMDKKFGESSGTQKMRINMSESAHHSLLI